MTTKTEMTRMLDAAHIAEDGYTTFGGNYAATYDISDDEAERIAGRASSAAEFTRIWETADWWTDANNA